jgi:MFS family permease
MRLRPKYRFLAALMVVGSIEQGIISIARISTSYRAIELDLSAIWIGVITASYALVPIFLAVPAGRYVDRGHDARLCWIGAGVLTTACAGFAFTHSLVGLLLSTILLGVAHLVLYIGLQVLCARDTTPGVMEQTFGNFMVANAIGQGIGSYVVGWAGGLASVAPTQVLFNINLAASVAALATTLLLRTPGFA